MSKTRIEIIRDVEKLIDEAESASFGRQLADQMVKNWISNQKDPTKYDAGKTRKVSSKPSKLIRGRSTQPTLKPDGSIKRRR